jgi:hypothetical protein
VVVTLRRSPFEGCKDDPAEVELVFVEVRPFDDCAGGRTADLLGREVVADRLFNADQAIDGQRISKELPASVQCCGASASPPPSVQGPFGRSSLS